MTVQRTARPPISAGGLGGGGSGPRRSVERGYWLRRGRSGAGRILMSAVPPLHRHSKLDHLVLYRPGTGIVSILKNSGGTFRQIF